MGDTKAGSEKRFGSARCLIVDDEPRTVKVYERQLAPHFLEVHTATDVAGAARVLIEGAQSGAPIHALLLDLHLGDERGEDVLDVAERLPFRPRVVVVSGLDHGSLRVLQVQYRAVFLPKPADPEAILIGFTPRRAQVFELAELHELADREVDVVALISVDAPDAEIAEHLGMSYGTVRKHIDRLGAKLGASGRRGIQAALLRFADGRQQGGVPPPGRPPTDQGPPPPPPGAPRAPGGRGGPPAVQRGGPARGAFA
jgi:DNA-binding NarL/FixJ family response regulator